MKTWFRPGHYVAGYIIAAVITAAWVTSDPCPLRPGHRVDQCGDRPDAVMAGYFSGIVWPGYWLMKAFEQMRKS